MEWLIAVVLRPFGALLFWGGAALLSVALLPIIPKRWRPILYDKGIQKRNPWKFAIFGMTTCYGTLAIVAYFVTR